MITWQSNYLNQYRKEVKTGKDGHYLNQYRKEVKASKDGHYLNPHREETFSHGREMYFKFI